ncbi:hypothetical protein A8F43_03920 [Burkholderia cenocepacia]|nr:hypothetical protein A8F39_21940 [Burkholderia cenocepacia]ONZ30875.1 hypothetical protein A8F41_05820 [Burkholderia cenocepacia]ONZ36931.1 hypothetical protein A8F44_00665 [Burkholderia cenocepacia]ONZ55242.1 hypothetical protein A8F42_25575 [Burkholderia cenocepacia]ONZ75846.1 hypothetical protein A8F43_03920 [Burkholderia cenocepacia]
MNGATNETMEATRREARPRRSVSLPVLSATGVAKRFDATVALAALDLSIGAGEVVALMGANGAGKSTFVKILSGALQADDGTLTLRGEPYRPASPHMAKRPASRPCTSRWPTPSCRRCRSPTTCCWTGCVTRRRRGARRRPRGVPRRVRLPSGSGSTSIWRRRSHRCRWPTSSA